MEQCVTILIALTADTEDLVVLKSSVVDAYIDLYMDQHKCPAAVENVARGHPRILKSLHKAGINAFERCYTDEAVLGKFLTTVTGDICIYFKEDDSDGILPEIDSDVVYDLFFDDDASDVFDKVYKAIEAAFAKEVMPLISEELNRVQSHDDMVGELEDVIRCLPRSDVKQLWDKYVGGVEQGE